eukprot:1145222-Pelagomonas_calceolata.AAC.5
MQPTAHCSQLSPLTQDAPAQQQHATQSLWLQMVEMGWEEINHGFASLTAPISKPSKEHKLTRLDN